MPAATIFHGGVGLFFNFFYACRASDYGIDNVDFGHFITHAQVLLRVFSENAGSLSRGSVTGLMSMCRGVYGLPAEYIATHRVSSKPVLARFAKAIANAVCLFISVCSFKRYISRLSS